VRVPRLATRVTVRYESEDPKSIHHHFLLSHPSPRPTMASMTIASAKDEKPPAISSIPFDTSSEDTLFDTTPPPPPRGILARLRHYEAILDEKLGVEKGGPARILPEDRKPPNQAIMALMWASGTMNLSCFATGFLGWEFGLDLKQSILTVIFGTLLGAMVTVSRR